MDELAGNTERPKTVFSELLAEIASAHQYLVDQHTTVAVVERAILSHILFPNLCDHAANAPALVELGASRSIRNMGKSASNDTVLAEKEKDRGYLRVRSMHHVAIWSAVETCFEEMLCVLFLFKDDAVSRMHDSGYLKVKHADSRGKAAAQLRRWESTLGINMYLSRQEYMLNVLGLTVNFDDLSVRNIQEIAEIRNCIVHNKGIIDKKTIIRCPWVEEKYSEGDFVKIDLEDANRTFSYCGNVIQTLLESLVNSNLVPRKS